MPRIMSCSCKPRTIDGRICGAVATCKAADHIEREVKKKIKLQDDRRSMNDSTRFCGVFMKTVLRSFNDDCEDSVEPVCTRLIPQDFVHRPCYLWRQVLCTCSMSHPLVAPKARLHTPHSRVIFADMTLFSSFPLSKSSSFAFKFDSILLSKLKEPVF